MSDLSRHSHIERARILLKQKRYKDAEQHASAVLQGNPDDADALQIIGHCRLDTGRYDEAIKLFQQCLAAEPDDDYVHYLIAFAYYRNKGRDNAVAFLKSAISLNPHASAYYGLFAYIFLDKNWYEEALEKANQGLAVNAGDLTCLNARSQALFRLKNKEAAYDTIREALSVNPDDDFTHTNFGWHFMEAGKHKKAREHFRQALRINPNNSRARQGYKESLKANLAPYRWMLMFSLWLSAKSKKARWVIILVIWGSVRLLSGVSDAAGLGILAYILIGLYILFVIFSWVGTSIANIMLLLTKEGKYVLTKAEKYVAASVGICLLGALAITVFGGYIRGMKDGYQYFAALIVLLLTLPISRFEYIDGLKRYLYALIFTIALTALGLAAAALALIAPANEDVSILAFVYLAGIVVYTWSFSFIRG
ncbi:MAG TPA: tetratricopeptide repeat protein [Chitinophagaceae bacterium]|nr:tetratricopeptide repeat protein [Chitinophagaceae bacterium]